MHPWFENHIAKETLVEVTHKDLKVPRAIDFHQFIENHGGSTAHIFATYQFKKGEDLLFLDVETGRPQRPAYDIKRREVVAIIFSEGNYPPFILSDRIDFPDTPHQNNVPAGSPYSLCVDDRSWPEAELTYTPAELLQRIVEWFQKTSRDELHGINQPLDPFFFSTQANFTLPKDVFSIAEGDQFDLFAFFKSKDSGNNLSSYPITNAWSEEHSEGACVFIAIEVEPTQMKRIRSTPSTLADLHRELDQRGAKLLDLIAARIKRWIEEEDKWTYKRLDARLGVLLKMPIVHPRTGVIDGMNMIAFVLNDKSLGDVGIALNVIYPNPIKGGCTYGLAIPAGSWNIEDFEDFSLATGNVHAAFDPDLATKMAGHSEINSQKVVMIGAGAIGSMVAEPLSREGRFEWVIVDNDILFPHNLARHSLTAFDLDHPKAVGLAYKLAQNCTGLTSSYIAANSLALRDHEAEFKKATEEADYIFDASASVATSRNLCNLPVPARRLSFFYNPVGDTAVLMAEDALRKIDLITLEAFFYHQILTTPALADILRLEPSQIPYSGDCRALTTQLPASKVQILSGLVAMGINDILKTDKATLRIWQLNPESSVKASMVEVDEPIAKKNEWRVRILAPVESQLRKMRIMKLPCETGGALMGIVDVPNKRLEILHALPAPPDSKESRNEFLRGTEGLTDIVTESMARTLDQIRYVGEWHSHPLGCNSRPSCIDMRQLAELSATLSMDGCPGVQLIVGETDISVAILKKS